MKKLDKFLLFQSGMIIGGFISYEFFKANVSDVIFNHILITSGYVFALIFNTKQ